MNPAPVPAQRDSGSQYLAILAFDIRHFSDFTDSQRTKIASEFRNAIESAFEGTDLEQAWNEKKFCQNAGDGIVVGFDHLHLRDLVDRIPLSLQNRLRELHRREGLCVRMRLGVAVGPVQAIDDPRVDVAPNQPIIDACRIADAKQTKMLLENSDERVTYLAVAVTAAVMTGTIAPDHDWLRPSEFVRAQIDVADKGYHAEAYLHVPTPSGDLLRFGLVNMPASQRSEQPGAESLEDLIDQRGLKELRPSASNDRTESVQGDRHGDHAVVAGRGGTAQQGDNTYRAGETLAVAHGDGNVKVERNAYNQISPEDRRRFMGDERGDWR